MGEYADDAINAAMDDWLYDEEDYDVPSRPMRLTRRQRGTSAPPGSPLAKARRAAHLAFDPIWENGWMTRSEAYGWLAGQLDIAKCDCHMILFGEAMCQSVVSIANAYVFARELGLDLV